MPRIHFATFTLPAVTRRTGPSSPDAWLLVNAPGSLKLPLRSGWPFAGADRNIVSRARSCRLGEGGVAQST
jgi:hypothetical protein